MEFISTSVIKLNKKNARSVKRKIPNKVLDNPEFRLEKISNAPIAKTPTGNKNVISVIT